MMHVLLFTLVIMHGVEAVEVKKESSGVSFPDKKVTVNGSISMTVSRPASSILDCGIQCLTDGDCVAASYEDAGVCHNVLSAAGPISPQDISLADNSHTTAILPESTSTAYSLHMVGMVGWWPLQEAYEGKDLSGYGNDIRLHEVTFPDDGVTPWASPAAYFNGSLASYGDIQDGHHLDVKSFSWMAKVYLHDTESIQHVFQWRYIGGPGVKSRIASGIFSMIIFIPGCDQHGLVRHPTTLPLSAWFTMAATYDFPTNTLTLWLSGDSHVSTMDPCGTNIQTSPELNVGQRSNNKKPLHGRLSCLSLYSSAVDYDVMYAATMNHCGE